VDFWWNMEMMGLIKLLLLIAIIVVVTVRGVHAPLTRGRNKDLGQPGKWAPCWAFLSVPFDSQQEQCQCQTQHPCQHSQPHSPPNIVLFHHHHSQSYTSKHHQGTSHDIIICIIYHHNMKRVSDINYDL